MRVHPHERALVVVSYLSTRQPFFFYKVTEWAGISSARNILVRHYSSIVTLKGKMASYKAFQDAVNSLVSDPSIKAIDVIINLHGNSSLLVFAPQEPVLYKEMSFIKDAARKLRLLYSTACNGADGNGWLLHLGFRTVIGAKALNINALTEYPALLLAWRNGCTAREALQRSVGPVGRFTDNVGRMLNKEVDSSKVFSGDPTLTIDTMPDEPLA